MPNEKTLPRRIFLQGLGSIVVALPLLEITAPKRVLAQSSQSFAKRFVLFFSHGGIMTSRTRKAVYLPAGKFFGYDLWKPPYEQEKLTTLGEEMRPLEPFADDLLILRGVWNRTVSMRAPYLGGHGWANATTLTCADVKIVKDKNGEDDQLSLGPSIDQVIAEALQKRNSAPWSSINLAVYGHHYGTPFYKTAEKYVEGETNPQRAFNRLFTNVNPGQRPSNEINLLHKQKKSVLDGVMDGLVIFRKQLGKNDRLQIDEHFEHIRTMEKRLQQLNLVAPTCDLPNVKDANDAQITAPLMVDIALNALRCNLTNVVTIDLADITTPWLTSPLSQRGLVSFKIGHSLHHFLDSLKPGGTNDNDQDRKDWRTEMVVNRQWRMDLFGRLIKGLKDTPEAGGTMLDQSLLYFTSEFSCGVDHSSCEPPVLIAGRAGGQIRTGRQINHNSERDPEKPIVSTTSLHNVYTSFLQACGAQDSHFGNEDTFYKGPLNLG